MTKLRGWIMTASLGFLWACGSPEQATVDQFFRAAQSNDSTTIAYMAAVSSPVEVESWKVVEVSSRSTEPYTLPDLIEQFDAATKERAAAQEVRTKYAKDNQDALEQVILKLQKEPNYKFTGKLGEIQAEWTKQLDDRKAKEHVYQALKRNVNQETSIATKSVMRQVDVGKLRGAIAVTEMLLSVKPKDGAELPFKVTLRKYDLSEPESDRVEPARWVIVDIAGATPEARAAAAASKTREPASESAAAAESPAVAESSEPAESEKSAPAEAPAPKPKESQYTPRELRGLAKVQILNPETKVEGDQVISTIRARNASKDWITGFMVTEHWYDKQGNAVGSSSRTHRERFMPGEVVEMELRTRKGPDFYQNQFKFSHGNGEVNATTVGSFPKQGTE